MMFNKKSLFLLILLVFISGCNKNPLVDSSLQQGPIPLPQQKLTIMFDDCDDGDNQSKWGGFWFTFDDKEKGGDSIVEPPNGATFVMSATTDGGHSGESLYAARMTGKVTDTFTYGFIGMGCNLVADNSARDLYNNFKGFKFWTKGDGAYYKVALKDSFTNPDTDSYYTYVFQAPSEWTQIVVYFDDPNFKGLYGNPPSKKDSLSSVVAIQFQTGSNPPINSVELWVDDIEFFN